MLLRFNFCCLGCLQTAKASYVLLVTFFFYFRTACKLILEKKGWLTNLGWKETLHFFYLFQFFGAWAASKTDVGKEDMCIFSTFFLFLRLLTNSCWKKELCDTFCEFCKFLSQKKLNRLLST